MNGHGEPLLVMIHGVSSAGPWYADLRAVLKPFVRCHGVRYREYHCLGPLKVFFWPWALFLSMVLIAYAMAVPLEFRAVGDFRRWFPWLLLAAGLAEVVRTRGLTRGLAWALAGAWSFTCYLGWWNPPLVLFWFLWIATAWILWSELEWPQKVGRRVSAIAVTAGVALLGSAMWWYGASRGDMWLWGAAVGQIVLLELRESHFGDQNTAIWRGIMLAAWPILGFAVWLSSNDAPAWRLLAAFVLLFLGSVEPPFRMWRTVEKVHGLVAHARRDFHGEVHLVGHSLGTFLFGRHAESYPGLWERVILVGGVISEVYDWSPLLKEKDEQTRIQDIRNEHGGLDVVVRAIGYAGNWAREQRLGTAGWRGLRPVLPFVAHDVADPYNVCPKCPPETPVTRLHNFHFPGYMHSTYFFNRTHMRAFWLAYFLGQVPSEYAYFLKLCTVGARLLRKNRRADFEEVAAELRTIRWHWSGNAERTLDVEVKRRLGALLPDLDRRFPAANPLPSVQVIDRVSRMLCQLVDRAIDAQQRADSDPLLLETLNPPVAIDQASQAAFEVVQTELASIENLDAG